MAENDKFWTVLALIGCGVGAFFTGGCLSASNDTSTILNLSDTTAMPTGFSNEVGPGWAIATTTGGITTSFLAGGDDVPIIVIFKDRGSDRVPYTVAERRANRIYEITHNNECVDISSPIIIADSQLDCEALQEIFPFNNQDSILDKLELWDKLLENYQT